MFDCYSASGQAAARVLPEHKDWQAGRYGVLLTLFFSRTAWQLGDFFNVGFCVVVRGQQVPPLARFFSEGPQSLGWGHWPGHDCGPRDPLRVLKLSSDVFLSCLLSCLQVYVPWLLSEL